MGNIKINLKRTRKMKFTMTRKSMLMLTVLAVALQIVCSIGEEKVIAKNRMMVKEKISNVIEDSFKGWLNKITNQGNAAAKEFAGTAASAILEALGMSPKKDDSSTGNNTSAGKNSAGKDTAGKYSTGKYSSGKNSAGKYSTGKNSAGKDTAGKDTAGKYSTGKNSA